MTIVLIGKQIIGLCNVHWCLLLAFQLMCLLLYASRKILRYERNKHWKIASSSSQRSNV